MGLKNEEIINGLKHLSSTHRELHNNRRKYEWKVFFTFLSFYVLTVLAFLTKDFNIKVTEKCCYILLFVLIYITIAVFAILFLYNLHKANSKNVGVAEYCEDSIIEILNDGKNEYKKIKEIINTTKPRLWAFNFQLITIIVFTVSACIFICKAI